MTQSEAILQALRRGEQLTVLEALNRYGVFALSQRIGEINLDLKLRGEQPILSETVKLPSGKRVARYRLA